MRPKIIYVYDALCSWCYAFSPVMQAVHDYYCKEFDFEVLSGGMHVQKEAPSQAISAEPGNNHYKNVAEITGIVFGPAFLQNLDKGEGLVSSEMPAVALAVFKSLFPEKVMEFARNIQESIFFDGKRSDDAELYRYLAVNYGIDPDEFESRMNDEEFKEMARYDFALGKQLQVSSYPAAFIQQSDTKFYLIAQGYADYETMELRINNIKKELGL